MDRPRKPNLKLLAGVLGGGAGLLASGGRGVISGVNYGYNFVNEVEHKV